MTPTAPSLLLPITMNAPNLPLLSGVQLGPRPTDQSNLELASEGVRRYVWHSAYGDMLIEVKDGSAFVNGKRVLSVADLQDTKLPV